DLGCDVLCEKPMAIKVQDGLQIIKKAETTGKRFFVVKQNRYNPPVVLVKDLLSRNRLGTIQAFQLNCFRNRPDQYYQGSWMGTQDLDGGILFTQLSHFIDLLYWFLGDMDRVSGWRNNYGHQSSVQFEDTGVATIVMQSGAMG